VVFTLFRVRISKQLLYGKKSCASKEIRIEARWWKGLWFQSPDYEKEGSEFYSPCSFPSDNYEIQYLFMRVPKTGLLSGIVLVRGNSCACSLCSALEPQWTFVTVGWSHCPHYRNAQRCHRFSVPPRLHISFLPVAQLTAKSSGVTLNHSQRNPLF
jgi:hypothetical protein